MNAKKVIDNVVKAYRPLPGVKAVALFGSRARGTASDDSDINLMVVESSFPTQTTRAQVLSQLCDPGQPSSCRDIPIPADSFHVDGHLVNIWHINEDIICERISSVIKGRRLENSAIVSIVNESSILWDPRKQLEAWKTNINPIPDAYKRAVVPVLFSEIANILEYLSQNTSEMSPYFFQHELMATLTSLYEIIFIMNGHYLTLSHNIDHRMSHFQIMPDNFLKNVESILLLGCDEQGLLSKHRRLSLLTQQVGRFLESQDSFVLKAGWVQLKRAAPFLFEFAE